MITVHHLENSRSQRILWMLEELGADYKVIRYDRDPQTNLAPASLRDIHPLGKSPVIDVDGEVVAETGVIIEEPNDHFPEKGLRPAVGTPEYKRYRYWLHYAEASVFPILLLKLITTRMTEAPMPFFAKPVAKKVVAGVGDAYVDPNIKLHFDYIERELGKTQWFAGDALSGADIMMIFPLEAMMSRGAAGARPNIEAYVKKVHGRDAYQAALEKGGPYSFVGTDN